MKLSLTAAALTGISVFSYATCLVNATAWVVGYQSAGYTGWNMRQYDDLYVGNPREVAYIFGSNANTLPGAVCGSWTEWYIITNPAPGTCQAPGCLKPTHVNKDGTCGDYCSLSHKTLGETLCLMCLASAKQTNSHFCSKACADAAEMKGPMILEVPVGHVTFRDVTDQFKASWRHTGTKPPSVKRIYKIVSPQSSLASYNAYKSTVEARGQFVAAGRSAGNENRRWHGTKRECCFGDGKGFMQFCGSQTCSLCCIVRTSFDLGLFGKKTGWGRFGKGIYTSSTSSKSNDYSTNECRSPLKAILLNKVVVGKGCKLTQDNVALTSPPQGYDSVLAEKGGSLNYDELVVYTNDAIRPSFLVMYEA
ncbi:hypothetical protein F5890DRAFT_1589450 [Lentinula detonsa]|uniref:PARP catalytic domain-containing protein n=1 Tax=Lentinula detonsa TaxID=2804962 RepID=A0AA38PPC3_9AGAR|nr:hypothetical protein F5890DRAFT_1589450 [Lentinula detonsa]